MTDPTRRFSGRVEDYVRHRPGYPREIVGLLGEECGLTDASVVADVGYGTGILAKLFLDNGNRVFGVEPNEEMRRAGERLLGGYDRFASVPAAAEDTTLGDRSVDFVTVGQAFHWFDREAARAEFTRILRPDGWVVLAWNERRKTATPFLAAYERLLLTHGTDYEETGGGRIDTDEIEAFFEPGGFEARTFENRQVFDHDGLKGRLLSSSYVPRAKQPGYDAMLDELDSVFRACQENGEVAIEYDTPVYYGRL